jgi:hypothetical protein
VCIDDCCAKVTYELSWNRPYLVSYAAVGVICKTCVVWCTIYYNTLDLSSRIAGRHDFICEFSIQIQKVLHVELGWGRRTQSSKSPADIQRSPLLTDWALWLEVPRRRGDEYPWDRSISMWCIILTLESSSITSACFVRVPQGSSRALKFEKAAFLVGSLLRVLVKLDLRH